MIRTSGCDVTNFTVSDAEVYQVEAQARGPRVRSNPAEPQRAAQGFSWPANSSASSREYMIAAMRAGVIAFILLGILVLLVLF